MDKIFKLLKGDKKKEEIKEKEKDLPNFNIQEPLKQPETVIEQPKNEILILNTVSEIPKKNEGFYYKKYINQISKLKLVR